MTVYLKILGLYLFTLIIGHKYVLSILNKLTWQNFVTNNVFLDKKHNNNKTKN